MALESIFPEQTYTPIPGVGTPFAPYSPTNGKIPINPKIKTKMTAEKAGVKTTDELTDQPKGFGNWIKEHKLITIIVAFVLLLVILWATGVFKKRKKV